MPGHGLGNSKMHALFNSATTIFSIYLLGSILASGPSTLAEDSPVLGAVREHEHAPIVVPSMPVIERLPVKVIEPIDLKVGKSGSVLVADRAAQCVFRLNRDGEVSLPIADVSHLQRIQIDADDNLYILTSDAHESQIQMVTPIGTCIVLYDLNFAATSFVRDRTGQFIVAESSKSRIWEISTTGDVTELTQISQPVSDIVLNAGGQAEVLLESGDIVHVSAAGVVTRTGYAPSGSSRLMLLPDGSLLAIAGPLNGHAELVYPTRGNLRPTEFRRYAIVPQGTQAVGFDSLGNLVLANPDLRAITKVTSHFQVPCPHCGRLTEMHLKRDAEALINNHSRSF